MSNSRKKQQARKRAAEGAPLYATAAPAVEAPAPVVAPVASPPASAPALDEAVYERVVAVATRVGAMREEGDRVVYLYNGPTLSMKYVEASDAEDASLLVAVFREGVVFQVRGEQAVVYKPGPWLEAVAALEAAPVEEDLDDEDGAEAAT